jgi:hypothetical protein
MSRNVPVGRAYTEIWVEAFTNAHQFLVSN